MTTQLTPRNKVSFFFDKVNKCNCPIIVDTAALTGESASRLTYPERLVGVRQLAGHDQPEAPLGLRHVLQPPRRPYLRPSPLLLPRRHPLSVFSLPDAHILRAPTPGVFTGGEYQRQANLRGGLSYVTGRHSVKVGFDYHYGHRANPH